MSEHEHGWVVFFDERPMVRLHYVTSDWPFYIFRVELLSATIEEVLSLMSKGRPIGSHIRYRNRVFNIEASDSDFIMNPDRFPDDMTVALRDFRTPMPVRFLPASWQQVADYVRKLVNEWLRRLR